MSKFFLGFIVAIGMVIGCGAAGNTAVSSKTKQYPVIRIIQVGVADFRHDRFQDISVIKDTKTGQEYIYATGYQGGPCIIKVEDDE